MNPQELRAVIDGLRSSLRDDLMREVEGKIESYRRAVWVREEWCCNEMRAFATKVWNAPKPRNDEMWGVTYQLRGHHVNYCPFCGAYVGKSNSGKSHSGYVKEGL